MPIGKTLTEWALSVRKTHGKNRTANYAPKESLSSSGSDRQCVRLAKRKDEKAGEGGCLGSLW